MTDAPRQGMLDTSTVILLGGGRANPTELPDESVISAITLAELSVGPHVAHDDAERSARQQHLQQAEADFDVVPFDGDCGRAFGGVAAALRASGRKPQARTTRLLQRARSHMLFRSTPVIQKTSQGSRGWSSARSPTRTINRGFSTPVPGAGEYHRPSIRGRSIPSTA